MKKVFSFWLCFGALLLLVGDLQASEWSRFEKILERGIFGKEPPPPPPPPPEEVEPPPPVEWKQNYKVTAVMANKSTGEIKVSFKNVVNNTHFRLRVGEKEDEENFKLVRVDKSGEIEVEKDGSTEVLEINKSVAKPVTAKKEAPKPISVARNPGKPPPNSRFGSSRYRKGPPSGTTVHNSKGQPVPTGPEIESHLRAYQEEIIRKGLPQLPGVSITPDAAVRLQAEGHLRAGNEPQPGESEAPSIRPGNPRGSQFRR